MADNPCLLQAVLESTDDDGPRLVYADWLEENGDTEQAEFIRVQVRLAHLPEFAPDRYWLEHRQAKLLRRHSRRWLGDLDDERGYSIHCTRGFPGVITCPYSFWLERGEEIGARVPIHELCLTPHDGLSLEELWDHPPTRQQVRLTLGGKALTWLTQHRPDEFPPLPCLRALKLTGWVDLPGPDFHRLCQAPWLGTIAQLELSTREVHTANAELAADLLPERLRELLGAPSLANLRRLTITEGRLDVRVLQAIAETPGASSLRELHLNAYGRGEPITLATSPLSSEGFPALEHLAIRYPRIGPGLFRGGAGIPLLSRLRSLELTVGDMDEQAAGELATAPLPSLRHLHLCHLTGTNTLVKHLVRSPLLGQLESLLVIDGPLEESVGLELTRSPSLRNLRLLELTRVGLTTDAVEALAVSPHLANLQALTLTGNRIGDRAGAALARSANWEQLWHLDLISTGVGDQTARATATSPHLRSLAVLLMGGCPISNNAASALANSTTLPRLHLLGVYCPGLDAATRGRLESRYGECLILC